MTEYEQQTQAEEIATATQELLTAAREKLARLELHQTIYINLIVELLTLLGVESVKIEREKIETEVAGVNIAFNDNHFEVSRAPTMPLPVGNVQEVANTG